jgi:hypothetical protein
MRLTHTAIGIILLVFCSSLHSKNVTQSKARKIKSSLFTNKKYTVGPIIPGLNQGYVPQGLSYSEKYKLLCLSMYSDTNSPSVLAFIDINTGKIRHSQYLKESGTKFMYSHAGGVALGGNRLYVSSGKNIYVYPYSVAPNLAPIKVYASETAASFCTYHNSTLFVGEFVYGNKYKSKKSHHVTDRKGIRKYALICGYHEKDLSSPTFAISIRQKVQGAVFTKKYAYLSISYGRTNNSLIAAYYNPLNEKPHSKISISGQNIPLWFLDGKNHIKTLSFPPMSEGIAPLNGKMAILTESGARKYQTGGKGPIDNIIYYNLSTWSTLN